MNRIFTNIVSAAVTGIAISAVFLLMLREGKSLIALVLFIGAILLDLFAVIRQRRDEPAGMPAVRLLVSLAIEVFMVFKLEPRAVDLTAGEMSSDLNMLFMTFSCFILPAVMNVLAVFFWAIYLGAAEKSGAEEE